MPQVFYCSPLTRLRSTFMFYGDFVFLAGGDPREERAVGLQRLVEQVLVPYRLPVFEIPPGSDVESASLV